MLALKMLGYCLIALSFIIPMLLANETSETL
jgi:hypothetical protein